MADVSKCVSPRVHLHDGMWAIKSDHKYLDLEIITETGPHPVTDDLIIPGNQRVSLAFKNIKKAEKITVEAHKCL